MGATLVAAGDKDAVRQRSRPWGAPAGDAARVSIAHAFAVPTVATRAEGFAPAAARRHPLRARRRPPHRRAARARSARQAAAADGRRTRRAADPAHARQPGLGRALPARTPRLADRAA